MRSLWRPIDELTDKYNQQVLVYAPELVDLDFNPEGVSPGFWDDLAGPEVPDATRNCGFFPAGSWVGYGWDGHNDEPTKVDCNPTHFMIIEGPV